MIIRSSDQTSRVTLMKRFPLPRNFGVRRESRTEQGRTWAAPSGAKRLKTFEIYRYDPESHHNPHVDLYEVDLDDFAGILAVVRIVFDH
jgi:succinate dehydrogenase / fumarate reductase, iron-sulfur subunit